MKKKLLTTLLAAVLCTPQVAFAARDGEGMEYTSAGEGFYGSLRTMYTSKAGGGNSANGSKIQADGSRLGVRGTLDLGHGLTGLYRYEWSVHGDNGEAVGNTRLSYVGLRGHWGEFVAGSHWENDYNWVTAATDIASSGSGNFAPHFRRKNSFQYTSPEINGFQGSFRFTADGAAKEGGNSGVGSSFSEGANTFPGLMVAADGNADAANSSNIDEWAISGKYSSHGFTFGAAYEVVADGLLPVLLTGVGGSNVTVNVAGDPNGSKEDAVFWAARLGYGQDNWNVNWWYGEHNSSDRNVRQGSDAVNTLNDTKIFSVSGDLDLGKFAVVGIHERQTNAADQKDTVFVFNVDYKFTSRSKAYVAYIANDFDSDTTKDDEVRVGLRMDF